ncbi:MAG: ABC transporter ATP-binding protein [Pseudomonadota bacterium]
MSIAFSAIEHAYGDQAVLHGVDLEVEHGEIMALLGPSGSGKTTLLRLAAGLEPLQAGTIELPGQTVTPAACSAPEDRPTCLVFQQHALFPHLPVADNIAFGMEAPASTAARERVDELLSRAGLAGLGARYPHTLSGGQQQRVALARALAPSPAVMLLDEPFASVDVLLVRQLREEARLLLKETGTTTLLVTHDPEDAMLLADRIAVIVDGRIVQLGTPRALWTEPAHPFVAEVIGERQLLNGTWSDGVVDTVFGPVAGLPAADLASGATVKLAIDPRALAVERMPGGAGRVTDVRFAGRRTLLRVEAQGEVLHVELPASWQTVTGDLESAPGDALATPGFPVGASVSLTFAPSVVLLYA